jgi:hypothetical protein
MKGHPILGVISGFLFGLFLGITLFLYGVIPLSSDWLWILPLLGILLGLILAAWAPFGKGPGPEPAVVAPVAPAPPPAAAPPPVAATETADENSVEHETTKAKDADADSSEESEDTNSTDESMSD